MGNNQLIDYSGEKTVEPAHSAQYRVSLLGNYYPRNPSNGQVEDSIADLGDPLTYWNNAYIRNLFIDGKFIDPESISGETPNYTIQSGAVRPNSEQPLFIQPNGSNNTYTILASATNLVLTIKEALTVFTTDIVSPGLDVAPSTNNTALINQPTFTGQGFTRYEEIINIDNIGSEISSLVNTVQAFRVGTEIFRALVNATSLIPLERGFFWDSSLTQINNVTLTNNDTITLLKMAWVFAENTGTSSVVSYKEPTYSGVEPTSPVLGDYWFDIKKQLWKVYNGSIFDEVQRSLIGVVVMDDTNCIAARSFDFTKSFSKESTIRCVRSSSTRITTTENDNSINVYGNLIKYPISFRGWDMPADLESGVVESPNTLYYFYITETGEEKISDRRPNYRVELGGWYHPFYTWRWVGTSLNDGASNLTQIDDYVPVKVFTASGTWERPVNVNRVFVEVIGGGGGGASRFAAGVTGGITSFGGFLSATGGQGGFPTAGGAAASSYGGVGGAGFGGEINLTGGSGTGIPGGQDAFQTTGTGGSAARGGGGGRSDDINLLVLNGSPFGGGGAGVQGTTSGSGTNPGAGGGGGGYSARYVYFQFEHGVSVTIGSGGTGGSGTAGDGFQGAVIIHEFQNVIKDTR